MDDDVVRKFIETYVKLRDVRKKAFSCVDIYMEPFNPERYPCYMRYKGVYKSLMVRFSVLWAKLNSLGYDDGKILELLRGVGNDRR